jgi:hypothetical protein
MGFYWHRPAALVACFALASGALCCSKSKQMGSEAQRPVAASTAGVAATPSGGSACIQIKQLVPSSPQADDSGNTTEPMRVDLVASGADENLRSVELVYAEDDQEIRAFPIGDMHAGERSFTLPPGLHMNSPSQIVAVSLIAADGSETPANNLLLNAPDYVPPPRPVSVNRGKTARTEIPGSDVTIAKILPGVDREEAFSILQFGASDVNFVSLDGNMDETKGPAGQNPPQTLTFHGVNFTDKVLVHFATTKGGQSVEAKVALANIRAIATLATLEGGERNYPLTLYSADVAVPESITHSVASDFYVTWNLPASQVSCK